MVAHTPLLTCFAKPRNEERVQSCCAHHYALNQGLRRAHPPVGPALAQKSGGGNDNLALHSHKVQVEAVINSH
jgi:hypothetical protein